MKTKMKLSRAWPLANKIQTELEPACERIEKAGSVRRAKDTIGDIEFVIIPRLCPELPAQISLFDDEPPQMVSALDIVLEKMVYDKPHFRRDKNGPLLKSFLIQFDEDGSEVGLELWITTPEQWGYILALRTGPSEFNRAWVTQQCKNGLLPDQYKFKGGWLYRGNERLDTPKESDVFNLIGGYIPPDKRDDWHVYYEFPERENV